MGLPEKDVWSMKGDQTGSKTGKMKLIFATNNQHKVDEIRSVTGISSFDIITLKEAHIDIDIPEPFDTLEENASNKSRTIYEMKRMDPEVIGCFSEDTGLEVAALNGEPGVKSARYAGDERSFEKNIEKLLKKMEGVGNRKAKFRTVISLIIDEKENLFEGTCEGTIGQTKKGEGGVGYDPIFVPDGTVHTFAEMKMEEKNQFSHRRKATDKLIAYLSGNAFSKE